MKTVRMFLFALAIGAGIGAAYVWFGRPQFLVATVVISIAAMGWGFTAARNRRPPEAWMPPAGLGTLIFDVKPRDRSGFGCPRCPSAGFFEHRCVDGTIQPGALDDLAATTPIGIYLPDPEDDDLTIPFSIGAHE